MLAVEVAYGVVTVGAGSVLSLVLRCCTRSRQCMGERIVGGRLVLERRVVAGG